MEKSLEPSIITVLGTVVFRVIWLLTVFKMVPTYEMLMNVYVASWIDVYKRQYWSIAILLEKSLISLWKI